jgi:hypothetical protein
MSKQEIANYDEQVYAGVLGKVIGVYMCTPQILIGALTELLALAGFGRQARFPALRFTPCSQKRVGSAYELRADAVEQTRGRWGSHLN